MKTNVIAIQPGLRVYSSRPRPLVGWSCNCSFRELIVERQVCEAIARDSILKWLQVLTHAEDSVEAEKHRVGIRKRNGKVSLVFAQVFLDPIELNLSADGQLKLKQVLEAYCPIPAK